MKKTVLLIEPDKVMANVITRALQKDFSILLAHSAQAAITAADKKQPDVVVLEPRLAGHNGIEFLYEFRTYPEWQHIPVVVHSIEPVDRLQALASDLLGIRHFLYKPTTSLNGLADCLKSITVPAG